jgi:hypothetical protein
MGARAQECNGAEYGKDEQRVNKAGKPDMEGIRLE